MELLWIIYKKSCHKFLKLYDFVGRFLEHTSLVSDSDGFDIQLTGQCIAT